MAVASATSLSATFSSLSLNPLLRRNPCLSSSHRLHFPASKPPFPLISQPLHKPSPPRVKPSDIDTTYFDTFDPEAITTFNPPEPPEGFIPPPSFDEGPLQSKEDIDRAYEEIYGPFTTTKTIGIKSKRRERIRDGFLEKVVEVRRVTKIVKQGRQFHFRVVLVVGDKQGNVGVGVGKAEKVVFAIRKSAIDARKNIVLVPMTKYKTFPHRSEAYSGSAKVMLRPACPGTGVIAGGAVRIVLEMAGVENALGKQLGSPNPLNNARATVVAIQQMRQFREVAEERGIPMEELWK